MELVHQQTLGNSPNFKVEHSHEELVSSNSVSASSSEFSFSCIVQPNAILSGNQLPLDLSPADDIFFYGHLLPLHLFPQLPVSPRSSATSLDSFTLHRTEFKQKLIPLPDFTEPARLPKSKSLGFFKRWMRGPELGKSEETEKKMKKKTKDRFELSGILKRYARLVRPSLMFSEARRNKSTNEYKPQPISHSGDLSFRVKQEAKGRRGKYYSAPASIRTSPVNSGILFTSAKSMPSPVADSTMVELQSAIQAAIAHCKNSSAATDTPCKV